jgi:hypothetical protein
VIVATFSLAQHLHAVSHRYDQFDFRIFYAWGADYLSGGDPWTDRRGVMGGCNYTPVFVAMFSMLARLDRKTAFWVWQAAQLLCLLTAVVLLARANAPPLGIAPTLIVLSLVLLSRPLMGVLVWSNISPILLVLLSATWVCAGRQRPALAGLWLALATLLKLYPAVAAGYFLFGRRWRALGWTMGFFVAGVLLTNPVHWIELMTQNLPIAYHVKGGSGGLTVLTFVRRTVSFFTGIRIVDEPLLAVLGFTVLIDLALVVIAAMATITGRTRVDLDGLLFGLWIALALLMSPLGWEHDTVLLLPAYLFGLYAAWDGFHPHEAAPQLTLIAGAATLAICIVSALIKALPHPGFLVLLAAYLGAALIFRARRQCCPSLSLRNHGSRSRGVPDAQ